MAISGQRTIDRHPIVNDDDGAQCRRSAGEVEGSHEFEEIEHHSSQSVSNKAAPTARIILEDGKLRAYVVGDPVATDTLTVARSNPSNILFTNNDDGLYRLTAFAGTEVDRGQRHRGQGRPPDVHDAARPGWRGHAHRHVPEDLDVRRPRRPVLAVGARHRANRSR